MEYLEVALDALLDTAKLILPLLLVYMLIEFVEERRQAAFIRKIGVENKIAPLWGSLFGCIPQCGFSGIAAELFSHKFIAVGTLIAVFLATADEALPVLFSHLADDPARAAAAIGLILAVKIVSAAIIGLLIDAFVGLYRKKKGVKSEKCAHFESPEECSEETDCGNHHGECGCHHEGRKKGFLNGILLPAAIHTAKITLFVLVVNLALSFGLYFIGEENLKAFLTANDALSPLAASLLGLIPNCAVSVMLTELYFKGVLSFAAMIAGLSSGAGVGLFVLFRSNKNVKQNLLITLALFVAGAAVGYAVMGISAVF